MTAEQNKNSTEVFVRDFVAATFSVVRELTAERDAAMVEAAELRAMIAELRAEIEQDRGQA